jgi:hypothetical protein
LLSSIRKDRRNRLFCRYAIPRIAVLCIAVAGITGTMAPQASALTNRRLCMYVDGDLKGDSYRFVVANYAKGKKCPRVDPSKHPDLVTQQNPVPKRTCEQVSSFVGYGDDICRILRKDELYELNFSRRNLTYTTTDEGRVKYLG